MMYAPLKTVSTKINDFLTAHPTLLKIANNSSWLFLEQGVRFLIAMTVGLYVARYLGPSLYGSFNYALSLVTIIGVLAKLGLDGIIVRHIIEDQGATMEILGTAWVLKFIGALLSVGIVIGIGLWFQEGTEAYLLTLVMAISFLFQTTDVVNFWFQSHLQIAPMVVARCVGLLLGAAAKLWLIFSHASLMSFVWLFTAEAGITALAILLTYQHRGYTVTHWQFSLTRSRLYLREAWPLILSTSMAMLYLKIDQVMLGLMTSNTEVGIYAAAVRFSEIWYFIPLAITSSAYPLIIHAKKQSEELYGQQMQRLYDLMFWSALSIAVMVSAFAQPLIFILLGREYAASASILSLHIWSGIFVFLETARIRWITIQQLTKFQFFTTFLGAITNILLNLLLIPQYGGYGAAVATLISYAVAVYLSCFLYPSLWPAAKQMSKVVVAPLKVGRLVFSSFL